LLKYQNKKKVETLVKKKPEPKKVQTCEADAQAAMEITPEIYSKLLLNQPAKASKAIFQTVDKIFSVPSV